MSIDIDKEWFKQVDDAFADGELVGAPDLARKHVRDTTLPHIYRIDTGTLARTVAHLLRLRTSDYLSDSAERLLCYLARVVDTFLEGDTMREDHGKRVTAAV